MRTGGEGSAFIDKIKVRRKRIVLGLTFLLKWTDADAASLFSLITFIGKIIAVTKVR